MAKQEKLTAEAKFAALIARETEAVTERQAQEHRRSEKVERLRALRLAKQATDTVAKETNAEMRTAPTRPKLP